jgi:hypothetical protein
LLQDNRAHHNLRLVQGHGQLTHWLGSKPAVGGDPSRFAKQKGGSKAALSLSFGVGVSASALSEAAPVAVTFARRPVSPRLPEEIAQEIAQFPLELAQNPPGRSTGNNQDLLEARDRFWQFFRKAQDRQFFGTIPVSPWRRHDRYRRSSGRLLVLGQHAIGSLSDGADELRADREERGAQHVSRLIVGIIDFNYYGRGERMRAV